MPGIEDGKKEANEGRRSAGIIVAGSGAMGLVALFYMYADASERGEAFFQDAVWIMMVGGGIALISLVVGAYLYFGPGGKR